MNELESTKRLLVAESELNRVHLMHEWQTMADEAHAVANQLKAAGPIASAVASLVACLSSVRPPKSTPAAQKPSLFQTMLKGAELISSLWSAFRSRHHAGKNE